MADEVTGQVQGSNGERLQVTLGSRSFGIQARDLIPILLLIGGLAGGYLVYQGVSKDIARLDRQHDQVLAALQSNAVRIVEAIHQANEHREAQTEAIRKMLLLHELNQSREPQDRVPLELAPDALPQPEKGR